MLFAMYSLSCRIGIYVRIFKQSHFEFQSQNIGNCTVKFLNREFTLFNVLFDVIAKGIALQIYVHSRTQSQGCSFRIVVCNMVIVGKTFDTYKVRIHNSLKSPLLSQNICKQILVASAGNAVNRVVRRHYRTCTCFYGSSELRNVFTKKRSHSNIAGFAVQSSFACSVCGEVF